MMTEERYEIIKKWGNFIFLFHEKDVTAENREKFKKLLQKVTQTGEFTWATNKETQTVEITFALGRIDVQTKDGSFTVTMDQETRRALQAVKDRVKHAHTVSPNAEREVASTQGVSSTPAPLKIEERVEREVSNQTNEEESKAEEKTEEKEEEVFTGESVFLDFLGPDDKAWM